MPSEFVLQGLFALGEVSDVTGLGFDRGVHRVVCEGEEERLGRMIGHTGVDETNRFIGQSVGQIFLGVVGVREVGQKVGVVTGTGRCFGGEV